jgi:hypothetical protein
MKILPARAFAALLSTVAVLLLSRGSAAAQEQPAIAKDSMQVTAWTLPVYKKNYDIWSWVPKIAFRVNGPISSGKQLYAEFSLPGSGPWVKFDCSTGETQKGYWWKTECGGADIAEDKSITYTGTVNFAIRLRNELAGGDTTLFTGSMKVGNVRSNEQGPRAANKLVYYVDHDWNLPIGYVYLTAADGSAGWKFPRFNAAFWVRGEATNMLPHLFYQGKEVGKIYYQGEEVGKAGCDARIENGTSRFVDDSVPQKAKWARVECSFPNIAGWDKTGNKPDPLGQPHLLSANPGDYEVKIMWNNHLARSLKFSVRPDGRFDNGIAAANKLGTDRVIVPVQIIGDQDGQWNRTAWKTDAFYGNPLTGFTPLP